ncbi:MAG: Flp pilus assembly protein CpaB [Kiritimatiellae bacterium]|nr:Flp pilus assembly protein CpaB [Kiritimatiellia bacterium]
MKQKVILVVSILAGLVAAFLTRAYLAAKDAETRRAINTFNSRHGVMEVLTFARDVPGGTVLTRNDLGTKMVAASGLRGQALTLANLSDVLGKKTVIGHKTFDVLFWSDVEGGNPVSSGLAADVRRRKRAISVNVAGAASVSGMVRPNDHVDVIGTFSFPVPGSPDKTELVTHTMLQNVLVLATGRETAKTPPRNDMRSSAGFSTVTLEVSPREAEMLVFAEQIKGRLHLTLRNRSDTHVEEKPPQVDFKNIRSEIEELDKLRRAEAVLR